MAAAAASERAERRRRHERESVAWEREEGANEDWMLRCFSFYRCSPRVVYFPYPEQDETHFVSLTPHIASPTHQPLLKQLLT